ncbi:MAG: hypothetical protein J7M40_02880 [Planctomycetes bacterium]|nr:hypothetical protein [Planctomycetota bacterium]
MTDRRKRKENRQGSLKEFVTVAFAEDMELAKQYKKLLNDGDIPAAVKPQSDDAGGFPGIAVMVPEDHIDEAHVLIESQGAYNDFYDMVFHDDEYASEDFDDNDGF